MAGVGGLQVVSVGNKEERIVGRRRRIAGGAMRIGSWAEARRSGSWLEQGGADHGALMAGARNIVCRIKEHCDKQCGSAKR